MRVSKPFAVVVALGLIALVLWFRSENPTGGGPAPEVSSVPARFQSYPHRLKHLDDFPNPYYPSRQLAKLTTPQWIGEPDVDAAVILSIDDMRDPEKYEAVLRPILDRLKQIDGRAPVSIFTNAVDTEAPLLRRWLIEGLSLEVHTIDHPCPLLADGDFAKARRTTHDCIDLLHGIANQRPVAFRMPCCDSMNSLSPRFFSGIFRPATNAGHFLTMDSSVFHVFTADDPELPSSIFADDQQDRFRKYLPLGKDFVNHIENYPYPYVVDGLCWELPAAVPSDWEAQYYHGKGETGPGNRHPRTVEDMKAGIDATVAKKGLFTLCFHPHGWIAPEQIVSLIDHAVAKHGDRIRFLTMAEAQDRLNRHFLGRAALRAEDGSDAGVRVLDVNADGFMDVVATQAAQCPTRVWQDEDRRWRTFTLPSEHLTRARFGVLQSTGEASFLGEDNGRLALWHWRAEGWVLEANPPPAAEGDLGQTAWSFRDLDGDGRDELLLTASLRTRVFRFADGGSWVVLADLPEPATSASRLVDLDGDRDLDMLYSDNQRFAAHRQDGGAWVKARAASRGQYPPEQELPSFLADDGFDNGAWFHADRLIVQNEHTSTRPNVIDHRKLAELLQPLPPAPPKPTLTDSQPLGAAEALASMRVPEGFAVELAAAEPDVMDPIDISWGPDGKLWVVEMADYPLGIDGKGKAGGRVRFLTDTDGDGRYEKSTLFLDGLSNPTSVMAWRKGALVLAAPELFLAEDTNGDGKADKREVILSGFGEGNQQHRANGLRWGLDGWVYLANGDSAGEITSPKTGVTLPLGGHDLRFRPDTGEMELESGQTQFCRAQNDAGDWFGCNNSFPLWHYLYPARYLGRNPNFAPPSPIHMLTGGNPAVFPASVTVERFNDFHTANRITSACGVGFYLDDYLGAEMNGQAFLCEPVHNLVTRFALTTQGATYSAARVASDAKSEFFASRDSWSRPTSAHTGPDGALYIVDMYRLVIEHPEWIPHEWEEKLNLRAGEDKGRIYRVVRKDRKPRAIPRIDQLGDPELVAALAHPNGATRDLAHQWILWRNGIDLIGQISGLLAHEDWRARIRALCVLSNLGQLSADQVVKGLADKHPAVRRQAMSLAEKTPGLTGAALAGVQENESSAVVQLAFSLGQFQDAEAGKALAELASRHYGDPHVRVAVQSSAMPHLAALVERALANRDAFAGLLLDLAKFAREAEDPAALTRLAEAVPTDGDIAPWQYETMRGYLAKFQDERGKAFLARVNELMEQGDASPDVRRQAIDFLARVNSPLNTATLTQFLAPANPLVIQEAALRALAEREPDELARLIVQGGGQWDPAIVERAHQLAAERKNLAKAILTALESRAEASANLPEEQAPENRPDLNALDPESKRQAVGEALLRRQEEHRRRLAEFTKVSPSLRQTLRNHLDEEVRRHAETLLGARVRTGRSDVLAMYGDTLRGPGNSNRGREVFRQQCALCHRLEDVGKEVGPDLASLSDLSRKFLLNSVLDPNQAVEDKYVAYIVHTTNGEAHMGVIASQAGDAIRLRMANGEERAWPRKEIAKLESTGRSLMPDGLEGSIGVDEMRDLLEFLGSVRSPRKEFPRNAPALIAANPDGSFDLPATRAAVHGPSLTFDQRYLHLENWSHPRDQAVWTIDCARGGEYRVALDYSDSSGANAFRLETRGRSMEATVPATTNENDYRLQDFGTITLEPGRQEIIVRARPPLQGTLMDLRGVSLKPL